jgi:hypothetical protein
VGVRVVFGLGLCIRRHIWGIGAYGLNIVLYLIHKIAIRTEDSQRSGLLQLLKLEVNTFSFSHQLELTSNDRDA